MLLKRVRIQNFRSIRDATVEVGRQTAILGANGAGKSTILRAIDRFYAASASVDLDDFFGRSTAEPIQIGLTFTDFSPTEREVFASRIHGDEMTVVRIFDASGGKGNGRYYGMSLQHPPFAAIRTASSATARRVQYNAIRDQGGGYVKLPAVSRADDIPEALARWEEQFPERCEPTLDDGSFFGFTNVANGKLQRATSFVFIPAIRDVTADAVDSKGAVVSRLMELLVRSAIQRRTEIRDWQTRAAQEYKDLTDPGRLHELEALSGDLTRTLQIFYADSGVALRWKAADEFSLPLPAAEVFLNDDGFEGPVDRKGHGLQRAFILTLLQHLARAVATEHENGEILSAAETAGATEKTVPSQPFTPEMPGLILAIEEPELYQHPTKQRHFAKVLSQLTDGRLPGVASRTQVIFASHSSLFVFMDRFDEVRVARRIASEGLDHKECRLASSTLDAVALRLERAHCHPAGTFTAESLRTRLHIIDAEIAEGLFADAVVLVEGTSDRAAIKASAELDGIDLEALGIAILPVGGKTKLDRPAAIFQELGIPTFIIWDCDNKGDRIDKPHCNRALQRLMGVAEAEIVDAASIVTATFCCFDCDLETTLKAEIGTKLFAEKIEKVKDRYSIEGRDEAQKIPLIMSEVLAEAAEAGSRSNTLSSVVRRITELRIQHF